MIKLYEKDSYLTENETRVTSCTEVEGEYYITLRESIFFPEEGGQNADTGSIYIMPGLLETADDQYNAIRLLDGKLYKALDKNIKEILDNKGIAEAIGEDEREIVVYKVGAAIEAGSAVKCELDYAFRYDRMQNHSGEHILTGVIHNNYGFDNVGFHLSDDNYVTLDINGLLTYDQVMAMEKEANRIIYANMPITDTYPDGEELQELNYRSKIEIDGQVRLITIADEKETVDICACCAPHVKRTGEVGIIKVISVINWKGGVRISMLAGRRALEFINSEHEIIKGLTGILTTSSDNIQELVKAHIDEIGMLKGKLATALEENIIAQINSELPVGVQDIGVIGEKTISDKGPVVEGNYIKFVSPDFPANSMKNIYNYMLSLYKGYVAVMSGDDENGYRYFGGSALKDSRELAAALRGRFDAKGGGKADMVQGQIKASSKEIEAVIMEL